MAIQLYCRACKSYVPVASKKCPKCGVVFPREGRKFRVDVSVKGKRVTRFVDNLTIAREVEGTIRGDLVRGEYDITTHKTPKAVTLGDVWENFAPWAQEHLKCWHTDDGFYGKHIEPRFGVKALRDISPLDLERMKLEFKKGTGGRSYSAQTIKHQLNLVSRLFNRAIAWGMFDGQKASCSRARERAAVVSRRMHMILESETLGPPAAHSRTDWKQPYPGKGA